MRQEKTFKLVLTALFAALSYIVYAPKTFILKLCIGLITGIIAHKIGKISTSTDKVHVFRFATLAAVGGLLFNVIFDPLIGYFYKLIILGKPAADLTLAWNIGATCINAITSCVAAVTIYMALRPVLLRNGLLFNIGKAENNEKLSTTTKKANCN